MTDTATRTSLRMLPLADFHRQNGATMIEQDGWLLPSHYGDAAAEYAAVRNGGAGVIDLSARGRMLVSGSEAVMFLNGLITNDMKTLAPNSWMAAAFPNVQGRLLAAVRVLNRGENFLIDTESATHETVGKLLDRFTLAGDFRVADVTDQIITLSIQGKAAPKTLSEIFPEPPAMIPPQNLVLAQSPDYGAVTIIRATHTAEDGFDLFIEADRAPRLWKRLLEAGAKPFGMDALEVMRVEAGIPRYGIDMDESTVVSETNLDDAISFTKGCYVGQEIIARIKYRGHVAKKLTGIVLDEDASLNDPAIFSADDKSIGRATSSTFSPRLNRRIALAYLKYDYLASETSVKIGAGESRSTGKVSELPFVRGSWHGE